MLDPNGKSTYFSNILFDHAKSIGSNFYTEMILFKYFSLLNDFGLNYKYVYVNKWNPNKCVINKRFDNEYILSGHCVITTLMIIHLISIQKLTPQYIFEMLSKLSDDELLFLIKEYTLGIYSLLK